MTRNGPAAPDSPYRSGSWRRMTSRLVVAGSLRSVFVLLVQDACINRFGKRDFEDIREVASAAKKKERNIHLVLTDGDGLPLKF